MALLRLPDVMARTALSRSAIYAAMGTGGFPRPVKIGQRLNAWPVDEIDNWIAGRMAQRDAANG